MAQAFAQVGRDKLPACRGRHPHLNKFDDACQLPPRTILLGATNGWFAVTLSVLAIPQPGSPLAQLISDGWTFFEDAESVIEAKAIAKTLKKTAQLPGIEAFTAPKVWAAIEAHRNGTVNEGQLDLKGPEWDILTSNPPPSDYPYFMSKVVGVPPGFSKWVSRVLLLERLREVSALVGFTRVEPPDQGGVRAPICRDAPEWVPANQVHGEGVFIQFDEERLTEWASSAGVRSLEAQMRAGHRGWRIKREILPPDDGFPGMRYVLLHTLAHLLIRELALECGYNAASIRERVYADTEGDRSQAGILIYTAAADSDGTLGGLVDLGRPESLARLLRQSIDRAKVCASDPLCSEHDPAKDQSLHAASCHACSFVSETSCESGNRYLDRALVVETLEVSDAAFFKGI